MTEGKRFYAGELSSHEYAVKVADFDRVTAERDAALEDLRLAKQLQTTTDAIVVMVDGQRDHWIEKCHALQQRLTAADERDDEAIDLLRRARAVIEGGGWADLERDIAKFFKPAEGGGEVNPSNCTAGHPGSNCNCELCRG